MFWGTFFGYFERYIITFCGTLWCSIIFWDTLCVKSTFWGTLWGKFIFWGTFAGTLREIYLHSEEQLCSNPHYKVSFSISIKNI